MEPILSCHNVEVEFNGFRALQGVNLQVFQREVRFLIGPNGAGKTTLLDAICGKTPFQKGKILFQNIPLPRKREYKIARLGIMRKFQAPSIFFNLTVEENLELALLAKVSFSHLLRKKISPHEQNKVDEILEMISLQELRNKRSGQLSHGQKQWLEIGMQMISNPFLLLLDEPIAGMTGSEREQTGELIHRIAKNCSVLVVEHDMDFVQSFSDQITVMHSGSVLCEGSIDDVKSDKRVAEIYLGAEVIH